MKNNQLPEVRFPEFKDDWKQRHISSLINEIRRPIKIENNKKYKLVTVKRRNGGIVSRGIFRGEDILVKKYFELKQGDYLISKRQVVHGANGFVPESLDGAVVSNEYLVSAENKNITTDFLTIISRLPQMYKMFFLSSYGIDIEKLVFNVEDWKKRTISIPSVDEQKKIADLFLKFDKTITLHQQELAALKQTKQGFLQKMFPKEGEKFPEVRFPGFTDDWEQRKLSQIADRYDNLRVPITASERISGDTPYYGANGIQDYVKGHTHDGEFILVAEDGANDLKNYPVQYINGKAWVNNHAHVLQSKEDIADNKFLMNAVKHINIEPFLVGGGRAKLNAEIMMKLHINIPSKKEQIQIGIFFKQLDDTIALHQRELEILKNTKKAFLQKMFV